MSDQTIFIANAGLVLVNPFLPVFFEKLDLLSSDDTGKHYIKRETDAARAVHLLQYLVTGESDTPEPNLILNKLFCGLPIVTNVPLSIKMSAEDLAICDSLLNTILGNWRALNGSSTEGLRETFLQRAGRLDSSEGAWNLRIERKTLDVLIDQVPWNISTVFLPWMTAPVHITW